VAAVSAAGVLKLPFRIEQFEKTKRLTGENVSLRQA